MSLEELRERIKAEGLNNSDYIDEGDSACLQCKAPFSKHLIIVSTRRKLGGVLRFIGEEDLTLDITELPEAARKEDGQ